MQTVQVRASFLKEHILKENENINGSGDKILVSHKDYYFPYEDPECEDDNFEFATVLIEKPLNEIYIDDDYDMQTFGLDNVLVYYGMPLSKLLDYQFKPNADVKDGVWYGCFIKLSELKPHEVIDQKLVRYNELP
jgi:hypothetical protein